MKRKCGHCRWLTGNKSTVGIACENPKREGKWRTRVSHYRYRTTPACCDYEPKDTKEEKPEPKGEQRVMTMTKEECIRDLKGSMELFLFDPSTGETIEPERLNEENRMTYEAMKAAVEFLEETESEKKKIEVKRKELEAMPKHERCWYYEPGDFLSKEERKKHYCVPDGAKTLGDRWEMKQEINLEKCADCQRYKCRFIEYPLPINGLDIKAPEAWGIEPALCRVRPAKEKKTYLGIFIGEIPRYTTASFNEESGTLKISTACNPMIYVPELERAVFGDESWWNCIEPGEDITDITDEQIRGQWYMKLLEGAAKEAENN